MKELFSLFCRGVGCKGTSVRFVATPEGIQTFWSDGNSEEESQGDGLSWSDIDALVRAKPASHGERKPGLNPQPKKGGKR